MKNALRFLMNAYNQNNFEGISAHLTVHCKYISQWVLDEKEGKEWIEDYLIQKSVAIKNSNSKIVAKHGIISYPYTGEDCIVLYQNDMQNVSCLLLAKYEGEKICEIDICIPELFQYEICE